MRIILRLLAFLRPFAGEVFAAVLLGVGTVAAGIGLLGTSAYLIALAALHPSIGALQVAIVGVRFFGITRGVLRYLERLVSHSVNFRLLARLRVWFYRAIEPLAPAGLEELRGGDLLARVVGDIDTLEHFYVRAVSPPLVALLITTGVGWFAGQYDRLAGWILTCGLVLAGTAAPLITFRAARTLGHAAAESRARLSVELLDGLQGMGELLVFGQEKQLQARMHAASQEFENASQRLARAGAWGNAVLVGVSGLTLWLMLTAVIPQVRSGALDGVSLAVLALLTTASFEAVLPLPLMAQHLEKALRSAGRLFEVADTTPQIQIPAQPQAFPARMDLSIRDLSFRYPSSASTALSDINLDLPQGKRIGIVGPSGAGKSTIASLLLRFWDCPPGTVQLGGTDIRSFDPADLRKHLGLVPQRTYLFSGSLRHNLQLVNPQATQPEIEAALASAGLVETVQRLPAGLDSWLGSQSEQLSGGERQRVALARALLQNPAVLILDEPTAGLDATTAADLMHTFRQVDGNHSLILITHHLPGLDWLDEILVLNHGQVVERGTHAQLLLNAGWYSQSLWLQRQAIDSWEL